MYIDGVACLRDGKKKWRKKREGMEGCIDKDLWTYTCARTYTRIYKLTNGHRQQKIFT